MEFRIRLLIAAIFWTSFNVVCCSDANDMCPKNGEYWRLDKKDGNYRCILECSSGDVPSDCHVVRPLPNGKYNKNIPFCKKGPAIGSGSMIEKFGARVVKAVVTVPFDLATLWLQGPAMVAGGWFAVLQRAATQIGIGTSADYVMKTYRGCEPE